MKNSNIQWTDHTWNIAVGCRKVDEDCKFCYMYRDSFDGKRYNPKEVRRTKTVFNLPMKIKEPSKIFTCSLTDFFIEEIDPYRAEAWDIIRKCPQHTFQILTKRPERILDCLPEDVSKFKNLWVGTSIGQDSKEALTRLSFLFHAADQVKTFLPFLSIEPLYGDVARLLKVRSFSFRYFIRWVIIGGESGNNNGKYRYRECKLEWIEEIVNICRASGIPVFVKQLGTHLAKELKLKDRHGADISEFPEHLRIREFPREAE